MNIHCIRDIWETLSESVNIFFTLAKGKDYSIAFTDTIAAALISGRNSHCRFSW